MNTSFVDGPTRGIQVRLLTVFLAALISACSANHKSIYREFALRDQSSVLIDAKQRSIIVGQRPKISQKFDANGKLLYSVNTGGGEIVCAEPAPDALSATAFALATEGKVSTPLGLGVGAGLQFGSSEQAANIGLRTQSIQVLRDYGYRLCEAYASGAITKRQYELLMRRGQKEVVAVLAIEQLTGVVKNDSHAVLSAGFADKMEQFGNLMGNRLDLQSQLDAVQTGILNVTKGVPVAGQTLASLTKKKDDLLGKLGASDGHLKKISDDILGFGDPDKKSKQGKDGSPKSKSGEKPGYVESAPSPAVGKAVAQVVGKIVDTVLQGNDRVQICLGVLAPADGAFDTSGGVDDAFLNYCRKLMEEDYQEEKLRNEAVSQLLADARQAKDTLSKRQRHTLERIAGLREKGGKNKDKSDDDEGSGDDNDGGDDHGKTNFALSLFNKQKGHDSIQGAACHGVAQEEIDWALGVESKIKNDYRPTEEETARYQDIARRLANKGCAEVAIDEKSYLFFKKKKVSDAGKKTVTAIEADQLQWGLDLLEKVQKQGYKPTKGELVAYERLLQRGLVAGALP